MSNEICPCDTFAFPKVISNAPGLTSFDYRVGDFTSFRHSLLLSLPKETQLANWRPGATDLTDDLGVQMIEWWACLADILTFYNWTIANDAFLLTARSESATNRLIRLLGYRPRPGLGSSGTVAAILSTSSSVRIPKGFQIQSKPNDGDQPQMFEAESDAILNPPVTYPTVAANAYKLLDTDGSIRLSGTISIKRSDKVLLVKRGSTDPAESDYLTVQSVDYKTDALGQTYTRVAFETTVGVPADAAADEYQLFRNQQFAQIWHFGDHTTDIANTARAVVHLVGTARSLLVGDLIVAVTSSGTSVAKVTANDEVIWWLNDPANPAPSTAPSNPLVAQHSKLTFEPAITSSWTTTGSIYYDWREVGQLIAIKDPTISGEVVTLESTGVSFPQIKNATVLLNDSLGVGALGEGSADAGSQYIQVGGLPQPTLTIPIDVHTGTFRVSRGESVSNEVLGTGDASIENQEFTLKKSPVTYLPGESISGEGYRSTISIWVDGLQWHEVTTLYGQPKDAKVFSTWEDDDRYTHVRFGSRLPTGVSVVASYRIGSGAKTPEAGQVSVIVTPIDGLSKIVSSVALTPGSDPDPSAKVKKYGPNSILTFGRAVSGDDYEIIAQQASGVTRARAYWQWDQNTQRATVVIYVGDSESAAQSARDAINLAADPNRRVSVYAAEAVDLAITMLLRVDPRYVADSVVSNVSDALLDDDAGLFGVNAIQIGQRFFDSDVYAACHAVAGVVAVHDLSITVNQSAIRHPMHDPGEGKYFVLRLDNLTIRTEVVRA